MEPKEYLKRYQTSNREIKALMDQRKQLWEKMTEFSVSAPKSPVKDDTPGSMRDMISSKITDIDQRIKSRIEALQTIKYEIEDTISHLPDRQREDLRLKYINGLTWEQIAIELNYSYRNVLYLHRKALQCIQKSA